MTAIKEYIGRSLIGKKFHFKCDCIFKMDFVGTVRDYKLSGDEIVWIVDKDGKYIDIGINHPKLFIEEV